MSTGMAADVQEYDLVQALRSKSWLKLPLAVMQDVGPAVQTMGGILHITNRETFSSVTAIATAAHVRPATCRKHLVTLAGNGWITNAGRQHTRRGAPRRTCTLRLPKHTIDLLQPYGLLPWWCTTKPRRAEPLCWSSKAVLSIIMSRLAGLISTVRDQEGKADLSTDDWWGSLANLNGDDRHWLFSRESLAQQTGLDPKSITAAKCELARRGIVRWTAFKRADGGDDKHALEPREEFRIRTSPTEREGFVFVDWLSGK